MERGFIRDINVQIHQLLVAHNISGDYLCECERPNCGEPWLPVSNADFAAALSTTDLYVVAPGHQPENAEIVWGSDDYLVVRDATPEMPEVSKRQPTMSELRRIRMTGRSRRVSRPAELSPTRAGGTS